MANIQPALRPHRTLSFSSRARRWTVSHILVSTNNMLTLRAPDMPPLRPRPHEMGLDHECLGDWAFGILGSSY